MPIFLYVLLFTLPLVYLTVTLGYFIKQRAANKPVKKALRTHAISFFIIMLLMGVFTFSAMAATEGAQDTAPVGTAAVQEETGQKSDKGMTMLAAGLAMGLAGIGAGVAVASGAPAAIAATSENPKSFAKSMIFVALGEAIAIYGFVIAFMIISS